MLDLITLAAAKAISGGGGGGGVTPQQLEEALTTKQNVLTAGDGITIDGDVISSDGTTYTAGTGIGIADDEIRVTYGEERYDDTPAFNGTMEQHDYTGFGTIYWGYAANDGDDPITNDDYVKIVADASGEGLTFIDFANGDVYQQSVVQVLGMLPSNPPATMQYGIGVNCHGIHVAQDLSSVYLVENAAGTEQTEPAFVLGLAMINGEPVIAILSNSNYVESGTYTVTKGTPPLNLPETAYDFGAVAVGDIRPVNGDSVKAALDETTQTISEIAEGRRTVYVFNNEAELDTWLLNPTKQDGSGEPAILYTGDVFLIRDTTQPDYWWDANVTPAVKRMLETRSFVLPAPDWTESSSSSPNYIKNKPNIPNTANWSTVTDHTGDTGIHVTSSEKSAWNGKYSKPSGGIPASDIASGVIPTLPGNIVTGANGGSAIQIVVSSTAPASGTAGNILTLVTG